MKNLNELMEEMKANEDLKWDDLPTFGGEEPEDTTGIWSWDEKNVLVGECAYDLEIITREEREQWGQ